MMKTAKIHITAEEAHSGCEKMLSLPEMTATLRIKLSPGVKDGQTIIVKNATFRDFNGQITTVPVLVRIYIDYQREKKRKFLTFALCPFLILLLGSGFLMGMMVGLSSDSNTTYQRLSLQVAEYLYLVEPYFVLGLSIVLSFFLWIVPRPVKFKSHTTYVVSAIIVLLIALSGCILHIRDHYTYIPDINLYHESLQSTQSRLQAAGLQISDENCEFDVMAKSKMKMGQEPYNYYFKVYQTEPTPHAFVRKDINVKIYVTWSDALAAIPINSEGTGKAEIQDIYGDINTDFIYPFNSDTFSLHTGAAGGKMTTEEFGESLLGMPPRGNISLVACLINYDTGEQIDTKLGILGDTITFSDIPDGTYYYTVSCEGYKTAIPDSPFKLRQDYNSKADILPWSVNLEEEGRPFSTAFKVCIRDINGEVVRNTEVYVRVANDENALLSGGILYPLHSDDNGYLTSWHGFNNLDFYSLVDFQLYDNCHLEVQFKEGGDFVRVEIEGQIGSCVMPNYS